MSKKIPVSTTAQLFVCFVYFVVPPTRAFSRDILRAKVFKREKIDCKVAHSVSFHVNYDQSVATMVATSE
jgi:hypothetical protein